MFKEKNVGSILYHPYSSKVFQILGIDEDTNSMFVYDFMKEKSYSIKENDFHWVSQLLLAGINGKSPALIDDPNVKFSDRYWFILRRLFQGGV